MAGEITYGLERLAMYVLGIENVFDLPYGSGGVTYGDLFPAGRTRVFALEF